MTSGHTVFMLLYSHMPKTFPKNVKPTPKQARAIAHVLAGKSPHRAMLLAGYAPNTAHTPSALTDTMAYKAVMEKNGMTEDYLSKRHKSLIESKKEDISLRAVDLAYKVTGKYHEAEKRTNTTPIFIQINPPQ